MGCLVLPCSWLCFFSDGFTHEQKGIFSLAPFFLGHAYLTTLVGQISSTNHSFDLAKNQRWNLIPLMKFYVSYRRNLTNSTVKI